MSPKRRPKRTTRKPASRPPESPRRPTRTPLVYKIGFGCLVLIGVVTSGLGLWSRLDGPTATAPRMFVVRPEDTPSSLAARLSEAGFVGSASLMRLYLQTLGRRGAPVPGGHLIASALSPREIALCLSRASGRPTVEVVIPEGFDHQRVAQRLEQRGVVPAAAMLQTLRARDVLDPLGIRSPDAEGYLFPATYRLAVDSDPVELLSRFVRETRNRLRQLDERLGGKRLETLAVSRGWGEREILTLASIVEKEARVDEERPIIASVFFNRLDSATFRPKRMLQSDPTAGYGCLVMRDRIESCRDYRQRITPAMLRDSANPYNTYRHPGLPPGPIASAGEASLAAVLKPATTDYLFFVAAGDGRHRFSRTLDEHQGNIQRPMEPVDREKAGP